MNAKIRSWIKTHKRMKWRLALRIASLPSERWIVKAAEWNPELSSRYKTYRAIRRLRRRWEDDINEFLKVEETETEISTQKVTTNTTTHGSKQQKTVEDGLYLKTTTQWLQKKDLKIMRDTEEILKADQEDMSTEWGWVTMKWPTSHNTESKRQIKSQKMKQSWKAVAAAPQSASCAS